VQFKVYFCILPLSLRQTQSHGIAYISNMIYQLYHRPTKLWVMFNNYKTSQFTRNYKFLVVNLADDYGTR